MWNGGEHTAGDIAAGRGMQGVDFQLLNHVTCLLPEHTVYFEPQYLDFFGLALIVHKQFRIVEYGTASIYRTPGWVSAIDIADHARPLQYITLETPKGMLTVINLHGAWQPGGKKDTPERLAQSRAIVEFAKRFSHPLILAGDFNLNLQTESIRLIEESGWENLIRSHNILSTRTSFYNKPEKFADYLFLKNGIQTNKFRILPEEVSDHAALFLEFTPQVL